MLKDVILTVDKLDITTIIAGIEWKNPVTVASGTFASGREYSSFVDLDKLGAITTKGVSFRPWVGNPPPRIAETHCGMLNAIGLQNPGIEAFIRDEIPYLKSLKTNIIVNVCGHNISEYCAVVERLSEVDAVDMLEINISCPNVSEGGMVFGTNWKMTEKIVKAVKEIAKQPIIVKLSPNVTDIDVIARAAESAGADALSMINTLIGMKIDIKTRRPLLANRIGGLSGSAIKPVAIRMVYQVAQAVKIPIIGMGGISSGEDAIEMFLAGASAVAIGTANFANPRATMDVIDGIWDYMQENNIKSIKELTGLSWKKW